MFTLGSAAVLAAGKFYEYSAQVAIRMGMRAVLLIGRTLAIGHSGLPTQSAWRSTRPTRCYFQGRRWLCTRAELERLRNAFARVSRC